MLTTEQLIARGMISAKLARKFDPLSRAMVEEFVPTTPQEILMSKIKRGSRGYGVSSGRISRREDWDQ